MAEEVIKSEPSDNAKSGGARPTSIKIDLNDPQYYINRELGLIDFQRRVLAEAQSEKYPILERIKFLAYVYHNMDEFFMVRVGGLHMQNAAGVADVSIDGLTAADQLAAIRKSAESLFSDAQTCWTDQLYPELKSAGIHILNYEELTKKQQQTVDENYLQTIFPTLTPLAFDPGHPFPHISNLSLNLAVFIEDNFGQQHFARVKVPTVSLPRFLPIKRSSGSVRKDGTVPYNHYFVWIEQVIAANMANLFPGMKILDVHPFRIVRNNDMEIQEIEAGDLLETMEESVQRRRFGRIIQLAVNEDIAEEALNLLISNLEVNRNDVYMKMGPLGLSNLMEISKIDRYDLKSKQFTPYMLPKLRFDQNQTEDIFSVIRNNEILLHHPYDSFDPVVNFINQAARDPRVLTIKQTLYRTGLKSPVVPALLKARRDYNKQVAVLVELKARFDEESNIVWAKRLEEQGVHVTYGLVGLKTHSKIALVVREDEDGIIRRYVHLGTGNYNHDTARSYEDFGYFTCDPEVGADATDLFNYLTGYSAIKQFRKLYVAPINLRDEFSKLIQREIDNQRNGIQGHMILKMNALADQKMIKLLYKASQAGVKVELLVRGISCIKPGIQGVSENIEVVSVLGRYLEHSRVYYFANGGEPAVLMGSADLMPRNLNNRVEVVFPIENKTLIGKIKSEILDVYLKSDIRAWKMNSDGTFSWKTDDPETAFDVQSYFRKEATKANKIMVI
jgi:polyphosphate kinase